MGRVRAVLQSPVLYVKITTDPTNHESILQPIAIHRANTRFCAALASHLRQCLGNSEYLRLWKTAHYHVRASMLCLDIS